LPPVGFDPSRIAEIELRLTVTKAWSTLYHNLMHVKGTGRDGRLWQDIWDSLDALFAESFYGPKHYPTARETIAIAMEAREGTDQKGLDGEAATARAEGIALTPLPLLNR
jgi:hypothetical protein